MAWLNGQPGAGKTTAAARIAAAVFGPRAVYHEWTRDDMRTPVRADVFGARRIHFRATPDLRVVQFGVFDKPHRKELEGADNINYMNRPALKAAVAELAERGQTEAVLIDGLMVMQQPFVRSVRAHTAELRVFRIDTPGPTAKRRYLARNRTMVREKRLRGMPPDGSWERAQPKTDKVDAAGDVVVPCANTEDATRKVLTYIQ